MEKSVDSDKEIIRQLGRQVKDKKLTWEQASIEYSNISGNKVSKENFRGRYRNLNDKYVPNPENKFVQPDISYENHLADGSIDIYKKILLNENDKKTPDTILKAFGYSVDDWKVSSWSFGSWEVPVKGDNNKVCTTVRAKIIPKLPNDFTPEDYIDIISNVFEKKIKPHKFESKKKINGLDKNKMLEITGIELHLGKLAFDSISGQNYNSDIAQERFYRILDEIVEQQDIEKCDTCFICIGNDFFNSDTVNNTTTNGTQQTNDNNWKSMFSLGLEMYINFITTLREHFNHIEVRLQQGNHDYMSSFYLYKALMCYFKNDNIVNFSDNTKDVQVFEWGNCAVFYTHGNKDMKRLIKSIPAEFYEIWGRTLYRELHLGHLHCEIVVDDNSGLITRRVGSPTGTDSWHYQERFVGSTQKYQTFIWNKDLGLSAIKYITFDK